jgi:hypothetical protein
MLFYYLFVLVLRTRPSRSQKAVHYPGAKLAHKNPFPGSPISVFAAHY